MNKTQPLTRAISDIARKRHSIIKANFKEVLQNYSYSELHTIDFIGKNPKSNVTRIAKNFMMTRGAISKIVKHLTQNGHIESYQIPDNKKEIYFRLTEEGEHIFHEHDRMHQIISTLDSEYFSAFSPELLATFHDILTGYKEFLITHESSYIQK